MYTALCFKHTQLIQRGIMLTGEESLLFVKKLQSIACSIIICFNNQA